MILERQVCSLELAKRLKELGVKQSGYFWWVKHPSGEWKVLFNERLVDYYDWETSKRKYTNVPLWGLGSFTAFTVAELGEMLPWFIEKGADRYEMNMMKNGTKIPFSLFYDEYHSRKMLENCLVEEATEADARAKMLIYLLENKLITL